MDDSHAIDYEIPSMPYHTRVATFYDDSDPVIQADQATSTLPVKMSADALRRSESCADPNALFMPHDDHWEHHEQHDEHPQDAAGTSYASAYPSHSRPAPMRGVSCDEQQFDWHCDNPPVLRRSDSMYEYYPSGCRSDGSQIVSPTHESFGPSHMYEMPPYNHTRSQPVLTPPPDGTAPPSPPSSFWNSTVDTEMDAQPDQKRTRLNRSQRIQRADGIRKNNAKFEIPRDRNLDILEHLIKNAPDEHSLKEYKMQKRLLRNREAALHSRQKKKEHTLKLEGEQKELQKHITALEAQIHVLKLQAEEHERERQEWRRHHSEAYKLINQLEMEKDTLVKSFAKESSELRNDIAKLQAPATNQSSPISTVPSTTGFSDLHSDIHTVGLDNNDWNDFDLVADFCIDLDPSAGSHPMSSHSSVDPIKKTHGPSMGLDKTAASELLLTLVLLGAYVAAHPTAVPVNLPSEIGTASSTVLDRFFADVGVALPETALDSQATPTGKSASCRTEKASQPTSYKQCTDLGAALDSLRSDNQVYSIASLYSGSILTRNARADVIGSFKSLITASCSDGAIKTDPDPANH